MNKTLFSVFVLLAGIVVTLHDATARRQKEQTVRGPAALLVHQIAIMRAKDLLPDIETDEAADRILALIANAQIEAGEVAGAMATARAMTGSAARHRVMASVVEQRLFEGSIADAVATSRSIEDERLRAETLRDIAEALAEEEEFEAARELAGGIELPHVRIETIAKIAAIIAEADETSVADELFEAGLSDARQIDDPAIRARAQLALIEASSSMRGASVAPALDDVHAAVREISDPRTKAEIESLASTVALAMAEDRDALETARGIADRNARSRTVTELARTTAEQGDFESALDIAHETAAMEDRITAISSVAQIIADEGNPEMAMKAFSGAIDLSMSQSDPRARSHALHELAKDQAESRLFDAALQTARLIEGPVFMASAFGEVAKALAEKSDDIERARDVAGFGREAARGIDEGQDRSLALIAVVEAFAHTGLVGSALEIAGELRSAERRAEAMAVVAEAAVRIDSDLFGDLEDALYAESIRRARAAALAILDDDQRDQSLAVIAKGQAEVGQPLAAADTAHLIESPYVRGRVLGLAAEVLLEQGEAGQALEIGTTLDDAAARAEALRNLAEAQAGEGDFDQALATVDSIDDPSARAVALSDVAEIEARQGMAERARDHIAQAIEQADNIGAPAVRSQTLNELARAEISVVGIEQARNTFARAIDAAQGIGNAVERQRVLYLIGKGRSQSEDLEGSLENVETIADPAGRALLLLEIGKEYRSADNVDDATETFERGLAAALAVENHALRSRVMGKVAEAYVEQADAEAIERAEEIAALAPHSDGHDQILIMVIGALAEKNATADALRLARAINHAPTRALALIDIAKASAEQEDIEEARAILAEADEGSIESVEAGFRPVLLREFAETYVKLGDPHDAFRVAERIDLLHERSAAYSAIAEVLMQRDGGPPGPPPHAGK